MSQKKSKSGCLTIAFITGISVGFFGPIGLIVAVFLIIIFWR